MSARPSALELCVGFDLGVYDRAFLADWVEAEVLAADAVAGPLLELSITLGKSDHDLGRLLRALAGADVRVEAELRMAFLGQLVESGQLELGTAVMALFRLAQGEGALDDDERAIVYYLDHAFDLAAAEVHGDLAGVRDELLCFCARYRHRLAGAR